jgi:hypothetical protein
MEAESWRMDRIWTNALISGTVIPVALVFKKMQAL